MQTSISWWMIRVLMLAVMALPFVIGAIVAAVREKRASAGPDPASAGVDPESIGTAPRPAVVSRLDYEPARREVAEANDVARFRVAARTARGLMPSGEAPRLDRRQSRENL